MTEMLPEVIMDDATIDEAVQFINERVVKIVYKGSLEIGQYVFERFFNNNIQLAGSKIANKPVSFRKLCARPDLKVSRSTLMNMVRVAAQRQFLVDGGINEEAVGYSQLVVLTRLENNEEKLALAQECIDEQLSERKLKLRVQEIRAQSLDLPVPPAVTVKKYLTRIERWVRGIQPPAEMSSRNSINSMAPADKEKILDVTGGLIEDISVISNKLIQLVAVLTETPASPETEPPVSPPVSTDA